MKKFKNLYIEITNSCNLKCSFCPRTGRSQREMTAAEFLSVLRIAVERTEYIYLHVVGEPLTHSNFDQILFHCDAQNAKIKLTTNGTLLNNPPQPTVSSHNSNAELIAFHSSVKAVNISLSCIKDFSESSAAAYLDNVFPSAKFLSQHGITVTLRTWLETRHGALIRNKLKQHFGYDLALSHNDIGLNGNESGLNRNGVQKIADRLLFDIASEFQWPIDTAAMLPDSTTRQPPAETTAKLSNKANCATSAETNAALSARTTTEPPLNKTNGGNPQAAPSPNPCLGLRKQLAILSDGTVVPCCLDSEGILALGNIFETPLGEILASPRAVKIAKGFESSRAVEPFCRTCTFQKRQQNG